MTLFHAIAFVDHQSAEILQFDALQVVVRKIREHLTFSSQHHSNLRGEHEFFGQICNGFHGIAEVLVVGAQTDLVDFQDYVAEYRPLMLPRIVGYEVIDHQTNDDLVAMARQYFIKHDQTISSRVLPI